MSRRYRIQRNVELPERNPIPGDDEVVAAVRKLTADSEAMMERAAERGIHYYSDPAPSANRVAHYLRLEGAARLGNGAVQGSWSGKMSPALRISPRLQSLVKRGLLEKHHDPDEGYRWVYTVRRSK